jgi:hypothetical protein
VARRAIIIIAFGHAQTIGSNSVQSLENSGQGEFT